MSFFRVTTEKSRFAHRAAMAFVEISWKAVFAWLVEIGRPDGLWIVQSRMGKSWNYF
jgi:hypothetical protein